jgi:hypothetical protein
MTISGTEKEDLKSTTLLFTTQLWISVKNVWWKNKLDSRKLFAEKAACCNEAERVPNSPTKHSRFVRIWFDEYIQASYKLNVDAAHLRRRQMKGTVKGNAQNQPWKSSFSNTVEYPKY